MQRGCMIYYKDVIDAISHKIMWDLPAGSMSTLIMSGERDIDVLAKFCHPSGIAALPDTVKLFHLKTGGLFPQTFTELSESQWRGIRQKLYDRSFDIYWATTALKAAPTDSPDFVDPFVRIDYFNPITGEMV